MNSPPTEAAGREARPTTTPDDRQDVGISTVPDVLDVAEQERAAWRTRFVEQQREAARRRELRRQLHQQVEVARSYGLPRRHASKLARWSA